MNFPTASEDMAVAPRNASWCNTSQLFNVFVGIHRIKESVCSSTLSGKCKKFNFWTVQLKFHLCIILIIILWYLEKSVKFSP